MNRGCQTLAELARGVQLPAAQLREALLLLIQHNCVVCCPPLRPRPRPDSCSTSLTSAPKLRIRLFIAAPVSDAQTAMRPLGFAIALQYSSWQAIASLT